VWIVAITVLCVRIEIYKEQTLLNLGFYQEKFYLKIWTQAAARCGMYFFSAALVLSQFLGHAVIHRALSEHPRGVRRQLGTGRERLAPPEPSRNAEATSLYAALPLKSLMSRSKGKCSALLTIGCFGTLFLLIAGMLSPALRVQYHLSVRIQKWVIDENIEIHDLIDTYSIWGSMYVQQQKLATRPLYFTCLHGMVAFTAPNAQYLLSTLGNS
jgi:hypothetical protein